MTHISPHLDALTTVLQPLAQYYDDPDTVEIRMNRPGYVVVDKRGEGKRELAAPHLNAATIHKVCHNLACITGAANFDIDKAPKLSCAIPGPMHRFECLVGNSVRSGLSLAIRCKHPFSVAWENMGLGENALTTTDFIAPLPDFNKWPMTTLGFLQHALETGKNIIISGSTSTGKTTMLNKLAEFLPDDRRVVVAEDTPELQIERFWDGVGLIAARDEKSSQGLVTWADLYDHMMRITPDHIWFGEISIQNTFAALSILNSGATGFACSVHAESPHQVPMKFAQNLDWTGRNLPNVKEFMHELVDIVIQIKRDMRGNRRVSDIYAPRLDKWIMTDGHVDRNAMHIAMKEAA